MRRAFGWLLITTTLAGCGPLGSELFVHGAALRPADAVVVLGNRPPRKPDGSVADETGRRVRRGVELFEQRLAPRFVVTGGPAPGGGTEAQVMSAYARELGVPADAITEEGRSRDTAENAGFSHRLLCPDEQHCADDIIVVTSPYHLRRAARLFECAGFRVQAAAAELPNDTGYQASFTAYEYAVGLTGLFRDSCARAAEVSSGGR